MGDLARRLVACPEWRWQEGVRSLFGDRVLSGPRPQSVAPHGADREVSGCGIRWSDGAAACDGYIPCPVCEPELFEEAATLPDLSDAATAGVLLSWLPQGCTILDDRPQGWAIGWGDWPQPVRAPILGEAAAMALLALWEARRG